MFNCISCDDFRSEDESILFGSCFNKHCPATVEKTFGCIHHSKLYEDPVPRQDIVVRLEEAQDFIIKDAISTINSERQASKRGRVNGKYYNDCVSKIRDICEKFPTGGHHSSILKEIAVLESKLK